MPSNVPPASDALVQSLIVGSATYVGVKHPEVAVLADATAGYLSTYTEAAMQQLRDFASVFMGRRGERVTRVLVEAAERAGIGIDELAARIEGDDRREQLLLRTLEAAAGTAMEAWLPLYATALANGTIADELGDVSWETMFVRVLGDLDGAHLQLLDRFTQSAKELGLGTGHPDFDKPINVMNEVQLERVASELSNRTALLAVLERHGLVARFTISPSEFSGGPVTATWAISDFGWDFHTRLIEVGDVLAKK
jgi:hypothetical protein